MAEKLGVAQRGVMVVNESKHVEDAFVHKMHRSAFWEDAWTSRRLSSQM